MAKRAQKPEPRSLKRKVAARRAAELSKRHSRAGTEFPHDNPSSGMHLLVAAAGPESPDRESVDRESRDRESGPRQRAG
jgi:hypothetical protein